MLILVFIHSRKKCVTVIPNALLKVTPFFLPGLLHASSDNCFLLILPYNNKHFILFKVSLLHLLPQE